MNVIGVEIKEPKKATEVFKQIERYREIKGCFLQIFDHKKVLGTEHMLWAYEKASYCMKEQINRCDTLEMETLLWASGCRQIKTAIKKMGLQDDAKNALVMLEGETEDFLNYMGWKKDDSILEPTIEKLIAFGITSTEIDTTEQPFDLVFEYMSTSVV